MTFSAYLSEIHAKIAAIEEMNKKRNLDEFTEFDSDFYKYREFLMKIEYLKNLTE